MKTKKNKSIVMITIKAEKIDGEFTPIFSYSKVFEKLDATAKMDFINEMRCCLDETQVEVMESLKK
jgi:hypothetical protein